MVRGGEIRDGSADPRGGPGRVGGPSGRYETGRGTIGEIRDGSWHTLGGSGLVGEVRDGLRTLEKVRDGSGQPWGGPGGVRRPSGMLGRG